MQLDLDSLLQSHGGDLSTSSDSDGESSAAAHRRTVDEILNETDSSDSPSSSPRPQTLVFNPVPKEETSILKEESATETLEEEPAATSFTWRRRRSQELLSSSTSLSSLGLRNSSTSSSSSSRPLPSLFGGVRPNAKPGAALAAAAAASRSVPTPHAAAIKSRRASSARSLQKVEPAADRSIGEENAGLEGMDGSNRSEVNEKVGVEDEEEDDVRCVEVSAEITGSSPSSSSLEDEMVVVDEVHVEERKELVASGSLAVQEELVNFSTNAQEVNYSIDTDNYEVDLEEALRVQIDDAFDKDACSRDGETSGDTGEEAKMESEIDRLVEERLDQLENSKKAEKKLRASMKPLERAEEIEKKHASYGLHWEEGAAAQPMRLEGIRRGPPAVGYLQIDLDNPVTRAISSQMFKRDYGLPQVVTVHLNYIAMGTSKGVVLVFPSKYSAHSADTMDSKMLAFGSHGEKSQTPVTSMCFNQQGDLLLVGYGDGHLAVWDVQKATAAKVITGAHTAPVVHTLFLGQDSQATKQFKAVTGDSKGFVSLHTFSVFSLANLVNRFSINTQHLLDGQKNGTVLSACPLLMNDLHGVSYASSQGNTTVSTSGLGSMVGGVVGGVVGGEGGWKLFNEGSSLGEEGVVIFVTHQNALVVRLSPNLDVYAQFSRPDGVREGSMPYTAWKCTTHSHASSSGSSDKVSWLVIAWDSRVQVAQLIKSELKIYKEWNLDSAAIGVAWLDDKMLVVLTLRGQLCLFAKDGTELHRTSFVVDGFSMDDYITYHTHFTNTFGNPEKAYHNSVAVRGATVYILGPMHLIISRLLPWKERIQVLQRAGDWMGALDMAMRLYDGHAHGVIDLPRTIDAIREAILPYLVELLLSYVDEVFSYISVAFFNQVGKAEQSEDPKSMDSSVHSEIGEQYARVGGVAVEFCVHINRTDILFDNIFSKFVSVKQEGTFLEILEPYILKDVLGCLPPGIMQALVEHYSGKGWLQRVEQCVLHMDISSLDFNQVVKLCREHGLYGALIYLFNRGLNDFKTPLEELLMVLRSKSSTDIGYKMLVYLKYCFRGFAFPPGHGSLSPSRLPSVRKELLQFLLEDSGSSRESKSCESSSRGYPNLCYLLWLDTEATVEVLRDAFLEEEHGSSNNSVHNLAGTSMGPTIAYDVGSEENKNAMVQHTTNVLISILDLESDVIRSYRMDEGTEVWPSRKHLGHLLEFIAFLVALKGATISGRALKHILEYLITCDLPPCSPGQKIEAIQKEKHVLTLLKSVPHTDWDSSFVLHLCTNAQFYQACGLIHTIERQHILALDSYMKDFDEPVHAFAFINSMLLQLKSMEASSFQSAIISRIPELVMLSRECTYFLVIEHFSSETHSILLNLHSHQQSLFLFLKTAIEVHLSGTLKFPVLDVSNIPFGTMKDMPNELEAYYERLSNFPKLLRDNMIEVTDEMAELYLELLCRYERNSVLKFLETFDNYRLEHCLRLCQEYGVTDAAAFLLERVGDVGGALVLVMTGLHGKIDSLVAAVENEIASSKCTETEQLVGIQEMLEVICVHDVLLASIGLCQRNTQRLDPQESESLWFHLLDSFSAPLRSFCCIKAVSDKQSRVGTLSATSGILVGEEEPLPGWRFPKFEKSASILRRLFSQFIGEIIEGMAGYIPLPAIMSKLLSDNGNQEFGDFKLSILRMLGTYGYERRILDTAKSLIEDDVFYTMGLLKKGASHAIAPQDFTCCICGCSLSKDSKTSGIRVFNCGHSTHLLCESGENEPHDRYTYNGCPICLPKKNSNPKSKSIFRENGSPRNYASSIQPTRGNPPNVQYIHDPDVEKPYVIQQMSRFEILNNLQKAQKSLPFETLPQLKLSPPAIYHEKVQKGSGPLAGETSSMVIKNEKPSRRWQLMELTSKGALNRFPLNSNIFRSEKNKVR